MKKTIIISAIALCFSIVSVNANSKTDIINKSNIEYAFKVNSFCVSIAKGDLVTVKKLIELGEDVNKMSEGLTPAMYAAKYNRTEILQLLIEQGADLKTKSDRKMTAADYAELHGALDTLAMIEEALSKK